MKKNYFLYIAIFIPIAMIISIFIGVRAFKVDLRSQYHFVYATFDPNIYYCQQQVLTKLFPKQYSNSGNSTDCSKVKVNYYIYDFSNNTSGVTSFNQVQKLNLIREASPDGYTIQNFCSAYPGWGWNDDMSYNACLKKGNYQKTIKLNQNSFLFLGWIK